MTRRLHIPGRRRHRGWNDPDMIVCARTLCGRWLRVENPHWIVVPPPWDGKILAGGGHGIAPATDMRLLFDGLVLMTGGKLDLVTQLDDCVRCAVVATGLLRLGLDETVLLPPWTRGEARWQRKEAT